jgi:hypothetical protein
MSGFRYTDSAFSVRARCSRTIWQAATWVGVLLASAAALFGFLTGESIQMLATSLLVLGIIPAVAVLLFAAMLVLLFRFLGTIYDFLTAALAYGFASCICLGTTFHTRIANFHEWNSYRVFARGAGQQVQAMMAGLLWIRRVLKRATERTRSGGAFVVQEIFLEFIWARQVAARLVAIIPFIAGWPVRTSARLLLRFMNWTHQTAISQAREVGRSTDRGVARSEAFRTPFVRELAHRAA